MECWSVYQGVLINSLVMRIERALMPFTTLRDRIKPNHRVDLVSTRVFRMYHRVTEYIGYIHETLPKSVLLLLLL